MKERLTVKQLRDYLAKLDPKFDDASVAIIKPGKETIVDEEIATKNCLDIVLSPTTDKERQAMLVLCGRETLDEIESIYEQRKPKKEEKKED